MSDQVFIIFILICFILIIGVQLLKAKMIESTMKDQLESKKSFIKRILQFNVALDKLNSEARYSYYSTKDRRIQKEEEFYGLTPGVNTEITNNIAERDKFNSDVKELMKIPNVGKVIAIRLIEVFGSLEELKKNDIVDLTSVQSVGVQLARKIAKYLNM